MKSMGALFTIHSDVRYEIVRKIYEGGMGIVYEAEQHGTRDFIKRVAIKVIRQNYATQKQFIENFIGEAKLVADLIHTNIVQTYHLGEAKGIFFIAMELIRGANLEQFSEQLNAKNRKLPVDLGVFITSRIARGLSYAHAKTDRDGKTLGIAIFDHPKNPRHPTWWHVRDYGLFAANPFGIHDFEKKSPGSGDLKVEPNGSVTFRYRLYVHEGNHEQGKVEERFSQYTKE